MAAKNGKRLVFLGILAFVIYFFAATMPAEEELMVIPEWRTSLETTVGNTVADSSTAETAKVQASTAASLFPFLVATRFGFADMDGHVVFSHEDDGTVELSKQAWVVKASDSHSTVSGPEGAERYGIEDQGLPFFIEDRLFTISTEQNELSSFSGTGEKKWSRVFPSPITCIDGRGSLVAVGLLDGGVQILKAASGVEVYAFAPGGSSYPVILGIRLSEDGTKIAMVAGIDPQRFLIVEESNGAYKVAHHEYLSSSFRRPIALSFLEAGRYVAFETDQGLSVYDSKSGSTHQLKAKGHLLSIANDVVDGRLFALFSTQEGRMLLGAELPDNVFFRASTAEPGPEKDAFLLRSGNRLILGSPGALAALDIIQR